MKCPFCGAKDTKVVNSRSTSDDNDIRRRRECESCEKRFTTIERIELAEVLVVKRDNTREIYSRKKLANGLVRACNKRPITALQIENIVDKVESYIYSKGVKEITSYDIGNFVMEELKKVDEVSYVRYASVCKQFEDIQVFLEELNKLLLEKNK